MQATELDLRPPEVRLQLYRGDHHEFLVALQERSTQTKRDLSAWTDWQARWRPNRTTEAPVVAFDVVLDTNNVDLYVIVTPAHTTQIEPIGVWELEGNSPDGEPVTLVTGSVELTFDVPPDGIPDGG